MFLLFLNQARSRKIHFALGVIFISAGLLLAALVAPVIYGLLMVAIGAVPLCASLYLGEKNFEAYDHLTSWRTIFNG